MEADLAASTALDMVDVCRSGLLLYALRRREGGELGRGELEVDLFVQSGLLGKWPNREWGFGVCLLQIGFAFSPVSNPFVLFFCFVFILRVALERAAVPRVKEVLQPSFRGKRWAALAPASPSSSPSGQITKSEIFPESKIT